MLVEYISVRIKQFLLLLISNVFCLYCLGSYLWRHTRQLARVGIKHFAGLIAYIYFIVF